MEVAISGNPHYVSSSPVSPVQFSEGGTQQHPPMHFVMPRGTPNASSSGTLSSPPPAGVGYRSPFKLEPRNPKLATPSPLIGGGSICRGWRKRRAHSISAPDISNIACADSAIGSPPSPPIVLRSMLPGFDIARSLSNDDSSQSDSPSPQNGRSLGASMTAPSLDFMEETDALKLRDLSIQSPVAQNQSQVFTPSAYSHQQVTGSSFTVYSESPARSFHKTECGSITSGSLLTAGARTPTSARSSPRQVPLTVLSSSLASCSPARPPYHPLSEKSSWLVSLDLEEGNDRGKASPRKNYPKSHPLVSTPGGIMKKLGCKSSIVDNSESSLLQRLPNVRTVASKSPRTPLPKMWLAQRSPCTSASTPGSGKESKCNTSIFGKSGCSPHQTPLGNTTITALSPRTPLPKISLAPRTPLGESRHGHLPCFPSLLELDESFTLESAENKQEVHNDAMIKSTCFTSDTGSGLHGAKQSPSLNHARNGESSNSLAFSADGSTFDLQPGNEIQNSNSFGGFILEVDTHKSSQKETRRNQEMKQSFLPLDHWHCSSGSPLNTDFRGCNDLPSDHENSGAQQRNKRKDTLAYCDGGLYGDTYGTRSTSLLTPSRSRDDMQSMLQNQERAKNSSVDTDSLSDSDEEFVLAAPKAIAAEKLDATSAILAYHDKCRRVKQKCQTPGQMPGHSTKVFANEEGLAAPVIHLESGLYSSSSTTKEPCVPKHCSLTSKSTQNFQSNASLFGMNIVHEEECSTIPLISQKAAPFCTFTPTAKNVSETFLFQTDSDDRFGSSNSLSRRRSDHSLGSIGLSLEGLNHLSVEDSCRDLVTPPILMRNGAISPPLLFHSTNFGIGSTI